jgi:hypothetical protein
MADRLIYLSTFNQKKNQARHTQLQNEERVVSWERGTVAELRRGCTFHKLPYLKVGALMRGYMAALSSERVSHIASL